MFDLNTVRMSDLIPLCLRLDGEPMDITDYPYLFDIYDSPWTEMLLLTGRQVSKSTTLASIVTLNAALQPNGRQICVSPLQNQAYEFSMQRLKSFLEDSPVITDAIFRGPRVVNQVLKKICSNNHTITLGYAQRSADRLRGQSLKGGTILKDDFASSPLLSYDESQDIFPEVFDVTREMAFRVTNPRFLTAGTPKTTGNYVEKLRSLSTDSQWAVKCTGCGKWNHQWTEVNVGKTGVICEKCGAPLDSRPGQWVHRRQLSSSSETRRVYIQGRRISQLMVHPIMTRPNKWAELLNKVATYPKSRLNNEVFGLPYDTGVVPVTRAEVENCCDPNLPNAIPGDDDRTVPSLVMGVDWAFTAQESYTFVVVGGYHQFPSRFTVYFAKKFYGAETDPRVQVKWILDTMKARRKIKLIGADWGAGYDKNLQLVDELGERSVAQFFHTALNSSGRSTMRARWEPKTRKWHLARTAVMTDVFEEFRRGSIRLPRVGECGDLIEHILNVTKEFNENTGTFRYSHVEPDDGMHALVFSTLAGELLSTGGFRGTAEPTSGLLSSAGDDDASYYQ